MRKLSRLAFAALIGAALAVPAGAEDGVTESEIVLGSHTALSGPLSAWGVGSTEGTRMRFDEANEKGIHGRKIRFVPAENQSGAYGVTESEIVLGSHNPLSGPLSAWGVG